LRRLVLVFIEEVLNEELPNETTGRGTSPTG